MSISSQYDTPYTHLHAVTRTLIFNTLYALALHAFYTHLHVSHTRNTHFFYYYTFFLRLHVIIIKYIRGK